MYEEPTNDGMLPEFMQKIRQKALERWAAEDASSPEHFEFVRRASLYFKFDSFAWDGKVGYYVETWESVRERFEARCTLHGISVEAYFASHAKDSAPVRNHIRDAVRANL
jgi:hypothetical protein